MFVKFRNNKFILSTPPNDEEQENLMSELINIPNLINLAEVLYFVMQDTKFDKYFEHFKTTHNVSKKPLLAILAGIISQGCHFGANRMSKMVKNIKAWELENALTWYFELETSLMQMIVCYTLYTG